uniref:Uncharacterized protein n=1 Tax=Arundo donax TaxID=35708 RepID=A0A0A9CRP4_ARUDO
MENPSGPGALLGFISLIASYTSLSVNSTTNISLSCSFIPLSSAHSDSQMETVETAPPVVGLLNNFL